MYNDFGTEVTIVEILDRLVPLEDPEISEALKKEFEDRGITVLTSTKADPESLEKTDSGVKITVAGAESGEQEETEGEGGGYGGEDPPTGEAAKLVAIPWRPRRCSSPSGGRPSPRTSTST